MASSSPLTDVIVAGYFPPPATGQAVATERLATLLDPVCRVSRVSLTGTHGLALQADAPPTLAGARGYARAALGWRRQLRQQPGATVLWTSVSPKPAGHLRDTFLVLPAFAPSQRVFGVVHWGIFARLGEPRVLQPLVRRMVARLDGFVFLDHALAERCAAFVPPDKRFVVPNTVSEEVVASEADLQQRRAARGPGQALRVLFLSNMLPEKGYDDVLGALAHLRRSGHAVEATFAGAWPDAVQEAHFAALVAEGDLAACVTYVGPVRERAAVRRLLLDHDVLAFPTRYATEAQPLVLLEALACGLPVVTTPIGAIGRMIAHGVEGRFVPSGAPDALADALAAYADTDRWRAASLAARARFERQFSPEAVRRAWMRLLDPA